MTTATPRTAVHKICPSCDHEITDGSAVGPACPRCGAKLVEIRDEADALIGTVIDNRFEIRDKLGQGGMGTVYRAWQRSVGREVAVKLIDRAYSSDPMSVRRFLREARLASQLSQPNTVSVFDFGQAADGRLFIAMELIRGRTLHKTVEIEGTFSIERTVRVGIQICDALEAAHGAGIIHRDLKLENVIVLDHPPGRDLVKVLDFGLAKNIRDGAGSRGTESGVVVGTPRYMAPEAAMSGDSLPAGDVYALGVMIGELSAGRPLWEGDSLPHLVTQKLDPAPAIRMVPAPLDRIVAAMIDPEPERRPTAPQAREMLVAAVEGPTADATLNDNDPSAKETAQLRTPRPQPTLPTRSSPKPRMAVVAPAPSLDDARPPSSNRRMLWLVLAAVAIGATVSITLVRACKDTTSTSAPTTPHVVTVVDAGVPSVIADAAPVIAATIDAPAPPAMVRVHVTSKPPGASIVLVKVPNPVQGTPDSFVLPRSSTRVQVRATLPGYVPRTMDIVPDRDQEIELTLKPLPHGGDDKVPF